ncbi:hypothetical protein HPP92_004759 [Vanilla planifolia]|uniref:DNA helicase n=1 Tax=Vanilla planifolia TaxID=51239 RepID=A0A835RFS4_VANPL|nr:hypothetical protein HPP92_004759 [Vanilla planifolia]
MAMAPGLPGPGSVRIKEQERHSGDGIQEWRQITTTPTAPPATQPAYICHSAFRRKDTKGEKYPAYKRSEDCFSSQNIKSLSVNTTLSGPLLSRFDIVLVLLDTKNPEWDAVVSSHILAENEESETRNDKADELGTFWPLSMLRRYIHYIKQHFKPMLTRESETIISSYYQLQRRSATQNAARTTVRMLESLIRLAQAHARLMFRNEVTQLDAIAAILCIESSMTTSAIVDAVGNALHSNFIDYPDEEYAKQEEMILEKLRAIRDFSCE